MVTPASFVKLRSESLTLQIQALDFNGTDDALTYSLTTAAAGVAITSHGVLTWPAEVTANSSAVLLVSDACGNSRSFDLSLIIIACPCEHALFTCAQQVNSSGQGSYDCVCVEGFSGENCTENIDDCASEPCLNGGSCVDGVAEYMCLCVPGYTGLNCEHNIDECGSNPCVK